MLPATALDAPLVDLRLRAIRGSLWSAIAVYVVLVTWPFIGEQLPQSPAYWVFVAAQVALAAVGFSLPWRTLLADPRSYPALRWGLLAQSLQAALLVLLTQGVPAEAFLPLFMLLAMFAAVTMRPRDATLIYLVGVAAWVAARTIGEPPAVAGGLFLTVGIVAAGAISTATTSRILQSSLAERAAAEAAASRRSSLLRAVEPMRSLDADLILQAVTDALATIDFDVALAVRMDAGRVTTAARTPLGDGVELEDNAVHAKLLTIVAGSDQPVVLDDYWTRPEAIPALSHAGIRTVVVAALRVDADLVGYVLCGGRADQRPHEDAIAAIGALTAEAGRSLAAIDASQAEHEAALRLTEIDAMKSDFVASVSHELRTPITVIRGVATTLREIGGELRLDEVDLLLDRMIVHAARLSTVVDELLDFSRFTAGRPDVHLQSLSLWSLASTALDELASLRADHVITLDLPRGLRVQADPDVLGQALEALLRNALVHTPAGTEVRVGAEVVGPGRVRVTISDDGPGISDLVVERARDGFARGGGHLTRAPGGLGLGLAIASRCIAAHAGHLELSRRARGGTVARFELALANSLTPPMAAREPQPNVHGQWAVGVAGDA